MRKAKNKMKMLRIRNGAAPARGRKRASGSSRFLTFFSFNGAADFGWCEVSLLRLHFLSCFTTSNRPIVRERSSHSEAPLGTLDRTI